MTPSEVRLALNSIGQWLARGDCNALTSVFDVPLPVSINDMFVVLSSDRQVAFEVRRYVRAAIRRGVTRYEIAHVDVEDQTPQRCLVRVAWSLQRSDGTIYSVSHARYVMRRATAPNPPKIEMVELIKTSFPDICTPDLPSVS